MTATRALGRDALILIDALPNIAPLPDLPGWLTKLRSWGEHHRRHPNVGAASQVGPVPPGRRAGLAVAGPVQRDHRRQSRPRDIQSPRRPVRDPSGVHHRLLSNWHTDGAGSGRNSGTSQQHSWEPYMRPENVFARCIPVCMVVEQAGVS